MRNTKTETRIIHQHLQERIETHGRWCDGCGDPTVLTPSHIIKRGRRRDLITEKRNIRKDCPYCHDAWDSDEVTRMCLLNDFKERMAYIKEVDELQFNRIVYKCKVEGIKYE